MLSPFLAELEQEFRKAWRADRPSNFESYLCLATPDERVELLARLIGAELELAYQPSAGGGGSTMLSEDDERAKPRMQLLLIRFPELKSREDLVLQLVMLEFALRLRFDTTTLNYDSYVDLCPNGRDRIENLMQVMESKMLSARPATTTFESANRSDTTVTEFNSSGVINLTQLPCSLGFFLLTNLIGKGGMGNVYNAIDLRSAAHVAVKVIRRMDSWSVYRFNEEFSWLSQLSHPHIVKLYDALSEADFRYFSMELVEGSPIRAWFQQIAGESDRWERLQIVLSQAASAVAFLHENGAVHRDIKSSNLMITLQDKAILLDLGLAFRRNQHEDSLRAIDGSQLIGTLQYLPPETLQGQPPSEAGDWYSFGVMMFETMTGKFPPIEVEVDTSRGSGKKYTVNTAQLTAELVGCPTNLANLCLDLLSISPQDRPDGACVSKQLGHDAVVPTAFEFREEDIVGREAANQYLDEGYRRTTSGDPVVRLIRGDSGLGKTTILSRWLTQLSRAHGEAIRLAIRCHRQDHTPLRALNLLVQELVTTLSNYPAELWGDLAVDGGCEIAQAFPQMERLTSVAWPELDHTSSPVESAARRAAGLQALLGWISGLSHKRDLVIAIDDAQWADADSGRMLSQLFLASSDFRGMLILVDQGTDVASPLVDALAEGCGLDAPEWEEYHVPPLREDDCKNLVRVWANRVKHEMSARIQADVVRRSGGNPFLLQELFRMYVNSVVRHKLGEDTWFAASRGNAGSIVQRRFSMLPERSEKILQYLAVADQPLGFHQLQIVSRVLPNQLLSELSSLSGQGWLRWNGTALDAEVEISHDRFREVILQAMPTERLHRRHFRVARALSSEVPPPWRRIGHHYSEARRFREAAACYMEGARAAAKKAAFSEALWMLERAFHPKAVRMQAEKEKALRLKADCLAGNGSSIAAAEIYDALFAEADHGQDRLLLECMAGEQWLRGGRLQLGLKRLQNALNKMQANPDDRRFLTRISLLFNGLRLSRLTPSMGIFDHKDIPFSTIEQCLNRVSGPLGFLDSMLGGALITKLANLALQRGTLNDRALAIMRWSVVLCYSQRGRRKQSLAWLRLSKKLARQSRDPSSQAKAHVAAFVWYSLQGRFRRSLVQFERARELFDSHRALDHWELGLMRWIEMNHCWYLGELKHLCAKTHEYRADASARNDDMAIFWMHVSGAHLVDLIEGNPARGMESIQLAESVVSAEPFQTPQVFLWMARVRQLLYGGDASQARELLLEKWPLLSGARVLNVSYYAWQIIPLRICCNLACLFAKLGRRDPLVRDTQHYLAKLRRFEEIAFVVNAEALSLVADVAAGHNVSDDTWKATRARLLSVDLNLFATAIQWHRGAQLGGDEGQAICDEALLALSSQGCADPKRLMEIILPCPPNLP